MQHEHATSLARSVPECPCRLGRRLPTISLRDEVTLRIIVAALFEAAIRDELAALPEAGAAGAPSDEGASQCQGCYAAPHRGLHRSSRH
jgi:hypothetical protein